MLMFDIAAVIVVINVLFGVSTLAIYPLDRRPDGGDPHQPWLPAQGDDQPQHRRLRNRQRQQRPGLRRAVEEAVEPMSQQRGLLIGGRWESGRTREAVTDPATGNTIGH